MFDKPSNRLSFYKIWKYDAIYGIVISREYNKFF